MNTSNLYLTWQQAEKTAHAITKGVYPREVVQKAQADAQKAADAYRNR